MKVLNFGSLNMDYVYTVDHFVRPGETISAHDLKMFCGGKGLNQSIAIARAGGEVYHAGCIGHDGQKLQEILDGNGVDTRFVSTMQQSSGHAIIQVDREGQNCIIIFGGTNQTLSTEYIDQVLAYFDKGDLILLQNEINHVPYIIEEAHKRGLEIALNPSPVSGAIKYFPLQYVKYFILNEIEGKELSGQDDPDEIANELLRRFNDSHIVLTLGKKGALYLDQNHRIRQGVYDVKVVDTTAAGDTFTGYFIAGVSKRLPVDQILINASKASSLSVSRFGAADSIPQKTEVERSELKLLS
jgi:ribokinase